MGYLHSTNSGMGRTYNTDGGELTERWSLEPRCPLTVRHWAFSSIACVGDRLPQGKPSSPLAQPFLLVVYIAAKSSPKKYAKVV